MRYRWILALLACLTTGSLFAQTVPVYLQKPFSTTYSPLPAATATALRLLDIEDYGHFLVAEVTSADTPSISDRALAYGLRGRTRPEYAEIRLRGFTITGMADAAPNLTPDMRITDYTGATGLYIVQFKRPPRSAWYQSLKATGVRILGALPETSYLIALAPSSRAVLTTIPRYRHNVVYQPGYKVEASLQSLVSSATRRVIVQLDRGQVWQPLVDQLRSTTPDPVFPSEIARHVNVGVTLSGTQVRNLARDSRVIWIEPVTRLALSDERFCQIGAGNFTESGATNPQQYLNFLNNSGLGSLGEYLVNVIDTGLDEGNPLPVHPDLETRIHSMLPDNDLNETDDSNGHGTMVAGVIAANPQQPGGTGLVDPLGFYYGTGIAPTAQLRITDIFNHFGVTQWNEMTTPAKLRTATKSAWDLGARFQNMSFNFPGCPGPPSCPTPQPASQAYDISAQTVDILVRDSTGSFDPASSNPMFISISAGNWPDAVMPPCSSCVLSPATAKNAVVMGSTSEVRDLSCADTAAVNEISAFSTRSAHNEPTRVKPDFVAPSTRIVSTFTSYRGDRYSQGGLCPATPDGIVPGTNGKYGFSRGTSFSAPQAAGMAVLLSKRFKNTYLFDPSPAMIKAMMAIGAERMIGGFDNLTGQLLTSTPGPQGWGRLNISKLVDGTVSIAADEDRDPIPFRRFTSSGQTLTYTLTVADPTKPIKIAFAFTDRYGLPPPEPSRVNELSIYAFQGGFTYCDGRVYDQEGHTPRSPGCDPPDSNNNLHFISIAPNSFTGQFQVQFRADVLRDVAVPGVDGGNPNQDWAAWVWNAN